MCQQPVLNDAGHGSHFMVTIIREWVKLVTGTLTPVLLWLNKGLVFKGRLRNHVLSGGKDIPGQPSQADHILNGC